MAVIIRNVIFLILIVANYGKVCYGQPIYEPTERDIERASRDPVNVDINLTPALTENEMYRDLVHLTSENFTDLVLKAKDPWVIIFHDGNFYKTWKTMAALMRGIIWMGLVNKEEKSILNICVSVTQILY